MAGPAMVLPRGDEHPDGDPFKELDSRKVTFLDRLEARALQEEHQLQDRVQGSSPHSRRQAHPPPNLPPSSPVRSQRITSNMYSSPKRPPHPELPKSKIDVLVLNDSSDGSSEDAEPNHEEAEPNPKDHPPPKVSSDSAQKSSWDTKPYVIIQKRSEQETGSRGKSTLQGLSKQRTLGRDPSHSPLSSVANSPVPQLPPTVTSSIVHKDSPNPEGLTQNGKSAGENPTPSSPNPDSHGEGSGHKGTGKVPSDSNSAAPNLHRTPETIRIEIQFPPRDNTAFVPQYNISELALAVGYGRKRVEEGGSGSGSGSDESGESDGDESKKADKVGAATASPILGASDLKMDNVEVNGANIETSAPFKKRRRRGATKILGRFGGYDVDDPFVDDSEIGLYEPKYYHQPKREGFFVCHGEVELTEGNGRGRGKNKQKPSELNTEGRNAQLTALLNNPTDSRFATSTSSVPPTQTPIGGHDVNILNPNFPSVLAVPSFGSTAKLPSPALKRRKKGVFSAELQKVLDNLKSEVLKENFEVKNKFPPRLRPILTATAWRALEIGEYDDDFFSILPKIFPYNLFTMKKLVKRELYPLRMDKLLKEQNEAFAQLRRGVNDTLQRQRLEFEMAHQEWEAGQQDREEAAFHKRRKMEEESILQDRERGTAEPEDPVDDRKEKISLKQTDRSTDDDGNSSPTLDDHDPLDDSDVPEPKWRYRFSETMKQLLLKIYTVEDTMSELTIEKQELEKTPGKHHSQLTARKALYAKIASLWPEDRMTTNQLSREISITKKKMDRDKEREDEE